MLLFLIIAQEKAPERLRGNYFVVRTGQGAFWMTAAETLPKSNPFTAPRPRLPQKAARLLGHYSRLF